jgi:hypothetical protein
MYGRFRIMRDTRTGTEMVRTHDGRPLAIVWTQEYLRYRANLCTHQQAIDRVMSQIAGGTILGVCGAAPPGRVQFPPRNESLDFQNQLQVKYRDDLRTDGSMEIAVDAVPTARTRHWFPSVTKQGVPPIFQILGNDSCQTEPLLEQFANAQLTRIGVVTTHIRPGYSRKNGVP